tara:strand:- start:568 stop:870 length:303 start_codon:yes stop_codon:yes gene_type:complete
MLESIKEAMKYTEEFLKIISKDKEVAIIEIHNIPNTEFYEVSIKLRDDTEFISVPSGAGRVHFMDKNNYIRTAMKNKPHESSTIVDVIQRRNPRSRSLKT